MTIRNLIQREIEAIRRDLAQRKEFYTLEEVINEREQYPSLISRYHRIEGHVTRTYDDIRNLPFTIRCLIHRARHGWSARDNWSMDFALAEELDGRFAEFITHFDGPDAFNGPPMTMQQMWEKGEDREWMARHEQEWLSDLRTIRKGFRDYWMTAENSYKIEDIDERIQAEKDASDGVRKSLELMGKWWEGLWW